MKIAIRTVLALFALIGLVQYCTAQSPVAITATITGANGAPYVYGSYQIQLVDSTGVPLSSVVENGIPYTNVQQSGALDSSGALAVSLIPNGYFLPSGTKWQFSVCSSKSSASLYVMTTIPVCFSASATVTTAGSLSATISASAPAVYYINPSTGAAYMGVVNGANVQTVAAPGTVRTLIGQITTGASYANGGNNLAGVRGLATLPSGATATTGYLYGTQGKTVISGILNGGALWIAGLQGQIDISAGTLTGASHLTPFWSDAGATGPAVSCTFCDGLTITNTTATTFNDLIYGYSKAAYFADLTDNGGGYLSTGSGATAAVSGYIKVKINGTDAYIRVYAAAN